MNELTAVAFVLVSTIACRSAESPPPRDPVSQAAPALVSSQPAELQALVARAKLDGAVAAWCRAEFQSGQRGSYAVAAGAGAGGRYLALDADGRATTLSAFAGRADLSCHTRAEAEQLDRSIRQSETIHGQVTPRWSTTVVCGFTDDTTAQCWQYSPADHAFVKVGGWTT
jgi:hypothetical protein